MMRSFLFSALLLSSILAYSDDSKTLESVSDHVDPKQLPPTPKLTWGRDPFEKRPGFALVNAKDQEEKIQLEGIYYSRRDPAAVINGNMVSPGDPVDQRYVKEIGKNFVLLEGDDSIIEISIPPAAEIQKFMKMTEYPDEVKNAEN